MMFVTHVAGAILFSLIFLRIAGYFDLVIFLLCIAGAVLPDIDSTKSMLGRRVWLVGILSKHRGIFHSLLLALAVSFGIYLIFGRTYYAIGLFIGYLSHILLDSLTRSGTAVFYPFSRFRIKGFIKTNSLMEYVLLAIMLAIISYLLL